MHEGSFLLFIVLVAGLLGKNDLIALAALVTLTLQAAGADLAFSFLGRFSVQVGVVFLLIGLLLPFAMGNPGFPALRANMLSPAGLLAVTVGAVSAYLAGEGVELLTLRPEVMMGLVVGSLIGVAWFDGIPAGPLVAGGTAAVLMRLFRL